MTKTTHNGIQVSIYGAQEVNMFKTMIMYKSGIKHEHIAKKIGVEHYKINKAIEWLKKHGEV